MCGGIFNDYFIANALLNVPVKKIEYRSIFDEVTTKKQWLTFLDHSEYIYMYVIQFILRASKYDAGQCR